VIKEKQTGKKPYNDNPLASLFFLAFNAFDHPANGLIGV
jgi:hypothetical protein